jgi:hypothetical protein
MFSVLVVASAGALSWVSSAAGRAVDKAVALGSRKVHTEIQKAMYEAVEDAAQAGAGESFSAMGPLLVVPIGQPVSEDPQFFQNQLVNHVTAVRNQVFMAFSGIKLDWVAAPHEDWDGWKDVEQLEAHAAWRRAASDLAGDRELPEVVWMANELEKGMWAKYVLENHSHRDLGPLGNTEESYDFVGFDILKRIVELGVPLGPIRTSTGVPMPVSTLSKLPERKPGEKVPTSKQLRYPIASEPMEDWTLKLVRWAMDFEPQNFVAAKKAMR